jgi:hypothetical protein
LAAQVVSGSGEPAEVLVEAGLKQEVVLTAAV